MRKPTNLTPHVIKEGRIVQPESVKIGDRISITSSDADTITVRAGKVGSIRRHGINGWTFRSERGIVLGVQQLPHSIIQIRVVLKVEEIEPLESFEAFQTAIEQTQEAAGGHFAANKKGPNF